MVSAEDEISERGEVMMSTHEPILDIQLADQSRGSG